MVARFSYLAVLAAWIAALWLGLDFAAKPRQAPTAVPTTQVDWVAFFAANILPNLPLADELDTPLRPPDGAGASITLPFLYQGHLGEDWTTAKGNAAVGEPVYSVGDGWVSVAQDFQSGWGKVAFICYRLPQGRWPPFIEVMYAELNTLEVTPGMFVKRGQRIGTIGFTADGIYQSHLHWEVRQTVGLGIGPGFDDRNRDGWLEPSAFLLAHRGVRFKSPLLMERLVVDPTELKEWGNDF